MKFYSASNDENWIEVRNSNEAFPGLRYPHTVIIGSSFLIDTHITRDGWPIQAAFSAFSRSWTVTVDTGEEEGVNHKGWTFDQNEMTATCPHGEHTEVDGDTECCTSILHELGI